MAKAPRIYTRLTRPTTSVGSYRSLWMAADHLLVVNSTGYAEEYRRIQFRNIQGFFTLSSERRSSWFIVWLLLSVLTGFLATLGQIMGRQPVVSLVFLGIGLIGMTWNHLLGPSCKVYVMTGVQTLQIPSLVRRRKARKVLARIEPIIEEAQRELAPQAPVAMPVAEPPPVL